MKLLAPVVAILLLSGCLGGGDDPVDAASTPQTAGDAPVDPSASASAPSSGAAASSSAPSSEATTATAPDGSVAPPVIVRTPFSFDGTLGASACVPAGPNSCFGGTLPTFERAFWSELEAPGRITAVELTLTWEAAGPTTEELRFGVGRVRSCGDNCIEGENAIPTVTGPSPLLLQGPLDALQEGEWYEVAGFEAAFTPEPIWMWAHAEQTFHIEGVIVSET